MLLIYEEILTVPLFDAIKKDGYTGGYSILTDYVRNWRNAVITSSKSAYVPLKFELGDAFQFDWRDEWLMVGGIHRKIQAAHTKLGYDNDSFIFGP